MRNLIIGALSLCAVTQASAQPGRSTAPAAVVPSGQVIVEHYYRIRWGSAGEFKRLYERNHAPILREMQRLGYVVRLETEEPFTHLSGGARWDLRVTITYRDAASAVVVGGEFDLASEVASRRLYPDRERFQTEEARRFSLLEEHWDVIVAAVTPG